MSFFILSNIEINFLELKLFLRIYTSIKIILIIKQVKLIENKNFTIVTLNIKEKTLYNLRN